MQAVGPFCHGATITALPTTSLNGIAGTGARLSTIPAPLSTRSPLMQVSVRLPQHLRSSLRRMLRLPLQASDRSATARRYQHSADTSLNGITGTWSPAIDNTGTTRYTFHLMQVSVRRAPMTITVNALPSVNARSGYEAFYSAPGTTLTGSVTGEGSFTYLTRSRLTGLLSPTHYYNTRQPI
ncbi:MAG: hypothetical protein MZV63_59065 [Marinilabiliales bacterium]|nr:hypothetical protein [Marinilabiliales bacterium]